MFVTTMRPSPASAQLWVTKQFGKVDPARAFGMNIVNKDDDVYPARMDINLRAWQAEGIYDIFTRLLTIKIIADIVIRNRYQKPLLENHL
jgi:hypothetical protein